MFVEEFQFVGQIADRADFHHARATLQGVQVAQQVFHLDCVARVGLPAGQRPGSAFDDIHAFFKEDLQQLLVAFLLRCLGLDRGPRRLGVMAEFAQGGKAFHHRLQCLALAQLRQQPGQQGMAAAQQADQLQGRTITPIHKPFVKQLQFMGEHIQRTDAGHPRTALEGVQIPLQRRQRRGVVGIVGPAPEGLVGAVQHIDGFFEEDRYHLVVHLLPGQLAGDVAQLGDARRTVALATDQAHRARVQPLFEQFAQGQQALGARLDLLPGGDLVKHVDQGFVRLLRFFKKARVSGQAAFLDGAIQVQQRLAQLVHLPQIGEVGALAEGGEFVEQRVQFLALAGVLLPAQQQGFGVQQDIHALFEEAGDQLRVALDPQALVRGVEQGLEPRADHLVDLFDQDVGALDRRQRRAAELLQAATQQGFGGLQQIDFIEVEAHLVGLELAGQQVQGGGQLGDRRDPGHGRAALERVQRPLQIVADRRREIDLGIGQEGVEPGQVGLCFVTEDLQQLRVEGLGVLAIGVGVVHRQGVQMAGEVFDMGVSMHLAGGELVDQRGHQGHRLANRLEYLGAAADAAFEHTVEQVLAGPGQFGQDRGADHPPAALERMETTAQLDQRLARMAFAAPAQPVLVHLAEDFLGFLEKDFAQFIVHRLRRSDRDRCRVQRPRQDRKAQRPEGTPGTGQQRLDLGLEIDAQGLQRIFQAADHLGEVLQRGAVGQALGLQHMGAKVIGTALHHGGRMRQHQHGQGATDLSEQVGERLQTHPVPAGLEAIGDQVAGLQQHAVGLVQHQLADLVDIGAGRRGLAAGFDGADHAAEGCLGVLQGSGDVDQRRLLRRFLEHRLQHRNLVENHPARLVEAEYGEGIGDLSQRRQQGLQALALTARVLLDALLDPQQVFAQCRHHRAHAVTVGQAALQGIQRQFEVFPATGSDNPQCAFAQGLDAAGGTQLVEQWQGQQRQVAPGNPQALQIQRQLAQCAEQRPLGVRLAVGQRAGQRFHFLGQQGRALELQEHQATVHLVQRLDTGAQPLAFANGELLKCLARLGQAFIDRLPDPGQGDEIMPVSHVYFQHIIHGFGTDPVGAGLPAIAMVNSLQQSLASQLPQGVRVTL